MKVNGDVVNATPDAQHWLTVRRVWEAGDTVTVELPTGLRGEHLLQPRTTAAQWVAASREGQNDAYIIDGYPAAPPSGSLEARFRF